MDKVEELFELADNFMIAKKNYTKAVSNLI